MVAFTKNLHVIANILPKYIIKQPYKNDGYIRGILIIDTLELI